MQNHDHLYVTRVCGTDHSGNSGYSHLTFLQVWTCPAERATKGTWKICNNSLSHLLFLKHHGCIQKRLIRVAGPQDSDVRGQAWFGLIRTGRCLQSNPHCWMCTTKPTGSGQSLLWGLGPPTTYAISSSLGAIAHPLHTWIHALPFSQPAGIKPRLCGNHHTQSVNFKSGFTSLQQGRVGHSQNQGERYTAKPQGQTSYGQSSATMQTENMRAVSLNMS